MPVNYELSEHVALITLDRPEKLNAIDPEMWREFGKSTARFLAEEAAWVAIITGSGERAFCAGSDVGAGLEPLLRETAPYAYTAPTIMRGQRATKPIIAAINGLALGGGLEIALACDIRIAARTARLGLPEVSLGVIPGWGGTQRLPRQVPWAVASRMILTGESISADEALAAGLVSLVVEASELMNEAQRFATLLCSRGPLALQAAKRAMLDGAALPLDQGLALENDVFLKLFATKDAAEGIAAFLERRAPHFRGG